MFTPPRSRLTGSSEYRAWMGLITVVCAFGAVSALVPMVEHIVGVALICVVLGWAAVAVLRRELRIRRRLAAIQPPAEAGGTNCRPRRPSIDPAVSTAPQTGGAA